MVPVYFFQNSNHPSTLSYSLINPQQCPITKIKVSKTSDKNTHKSFKTKILIKHPKPNTLKNMAHMATKYPPKAPSDTENISSKNYTKSKFSQAKTLSISKSWRASFTSLNFTIKIISWEIISSVGILTLTCFFK